MTNLERTHWSQKVATVLKYLLPPLALVGVASLFFLAYVAWSVPRYFPGANRGIPRVAVSTADSLEERYLDLLKRYLTRYDFGESYRKITLNTPLLRVAGRFLASRGLEVVQVSPADLGDRMVGMDWPLTAETMIGLKRLDNLEETIREVLQRRVPGDLIEAGAWRGGATIFMRAVLQVYHDEERRVWVADSFRGLPKPNAELYPADAGNTLWTYNQLAVPVEEVQANFRRYGLLDERVKFLVGWFKDTLPSAPIERLAVLRIDADLYESTTEALRYLYPKLSVGGYVIIDDYVIPACKKAVLDYRGEHGITEEIKRIDWTGVYWQKVR